MPKEYIPALFSITHSIQQLTRLLKPPPRSFRILIYARVIRANFTRGELEYRSNLSDQRVILKTRPSGRRQQSVQDIEYGSVTQTKGWTRVG